MREVIRVVGDWMYPDKALHRKLSEVGFEQTGDVHVDSLFYTDGMRPDLFARLEVSRIRSPGHERLWDELRRAVRHLVLLRVEGAIRKLSLLELDGYYRCKSQGAWRSIDEFGRSYRCSNIARESDADFQENIRHSFPVSQEPFEVTKVWWNGRMYWRNEDGCHHSAAAYVQALEQRRTYVLTCKVTHMELEKANARWIADNFHALVFSSRTADRLWHVLHGMEIPFQHGAYTPAGSHLGLMFFPRASRRAQAAVESIRQLSPSGTAFDFIAFLDSSLANGKIGDGDGVGCDR